MYEEALTMCDHTDFGSSENTSYHKHTLELKPVKQPLAPTASCKRSLVKKGILIRKHKSNQSLCETNKRKACSFNPPILISRTPAKRKNSLLGHHTHTHIYIYTTCKYNNIIYKYMYTYLYMFMYIYIYI